MIGCTKLQSGKMWMSRQRTTKEEARGRHSRLRRTCIKGKSTMNEWLEGNLKTCGRRRTMREDTEYGGGRSSNWKDMYYVQKQNIGGLQPSLVSCTQHVVAGTALLCWQTYNNVVQLAMKWRWMWLRVQILVHISRKTGMYVHCKFNRFIASSRRRRQSTAVIQPC